MKIITYIEWNEQAAAEAYGMTLRDHASFRNNRQVAKRMVLTWLTSRGFEPRKDGQGGFLVDWESRKYRLRMMTQTLLLAPDSNSRLNRAASAVEFRAGLGQTDGFLVVDMNRLPNAPVYEINNNEVIAWMYDEPFILTDKAEIRRDPFLDLVNRLAPVGARPLDRTSKDIVINEVPIAVYRKARSMAAEADVDLETWLKAMLEIATEDEPDPLYRKAEQGA